MAYQEDPGDLLCKLIDIESVTGNERHIMQFLEGELRELGCQITRYDMGNGRHNLVGSIGDGKPILCLNAHADTMPPSGNSVPKSTREGDVVRGLGSCDDKASVTSMMMALSGLRQEELEGRLDLLISIDEEVSSRGVRTCVEKGYRCDYAIVGEPTGLAPAIAHSGLVFLDLETTGIGGHGSRPWEGRNAILGMMDLYKGLDELVKGFPQHPLVGTPSTNLGVVSGGDATNRIPTSCDARVDVRVMPGMAISEAIRAMRRLVEDGGASMKVYKKGDPFETGETSVLLKTVMDVERKVLGREMEPIGMRGWTEADPLGNVARADTLVLGPGDIGQAHTENECVRLDQVGKASEIYFAVARELLMGVGS